MAIPPQAQRKAPSGPRKPHTLTEPARAAGSRPHLVRRITYTQLRPAMTPQSWIRTWAGVQKVSRPILLCQEMSHTLPTLPEVTASTQAQIYQGTRVDSARALSATGD